MLAILSDTMKLIIRLAIFCFFLPKELLCVLAPSPLCPGDTVAIIAPASCPEENQDTIAAGIKMLMQKGYKVKISPNLMTRYGYLAGTDCERARALMEAWIDPEVKAIWCWRGGFGCMRILDLIDYNVIRKHPKIFIGMSDITALHAAIIKETGLITFLGPNLNSVFGKGAKSNFTYNEIQAWNMISKSDFPVGGHLVSMPEQYPPRDQNVMTISPGIARGRLVGGTLSLVVSLIGTPWEIETEGNILILEEVEEQPYRIDRMLSQLKLAGFLKKPAGVILCSWRGCKGHRPDRTLSLEHIFRNYFSDAAYPVMMGFPSGHVENQTTLPLNAMAELDAAKKTLRILQEPVANLKSLF